jgi:ABC-type nitrate/sulfonate/bicarbonate transport system substrate-binding protein
MLGSVVAGCGGDDSPSPQREASPTTATIKVGMTDTGSGGILWTYIIEEGLDKKHNLNAELTHQTDFNALYQDFAAGRYDIVQAVPSSLLTMAAAGVPAQVLFPYSPANFFMIARRPLNIPRDLNDLRVAGATSSGSYQLAAAMLKEWYGFDLLAHSAPAATNLDAVAQLEAGTADAAIIFELDVTVALSQYNDLRVVWDPRKDFAERRSGKLWGTVFGYRSAANYPADVLARFREMIKEASAGLQSNPDRADALAQQVFKSRPGVVKQAFSSGRFVLEVPDETPQVNRDIRGVLEVQLPTLRGVTSIPDSMFR